jgi:hypothetical protein
MADLTNLARKISKQAAANTGEQRSQFKQIMAAIEQVATKLGQIFLLSGEDKQRYNAALTASRAPTAVAPSSEIAVPEPE